MEKTENPLPKNEKYVLSNFELMKDKSEKNLLILGSGIYGSIYLGKHIETGEKIAIKNIKKEEVECLEHDLDIIKKRLAIHKSLNHINISKLYNYVEDNDKIILFLEYAKKGTLLKKLINEQRLTEDKAFEYFIQIANAINFMHTNGYAHRNIKSENILLDKNDTIKLCNLGWCVDVSNTNSDNEETNLYNKGCDALALGVVLYEMLHGVINKNPNFKINEEYGLSNEVKSILKKLLEIDNSKRMSIKDIFEHPWVKKMNKLKEKEEIFKELNQHEYLNTDGNLTYRNNKRDKNSIKKKNNTEQTKVFCVSKFSTTSSSGSGSNDKENCRIKTSPNEKYSDKLLGNDLDICQNNKSFKLYNDYSPETLKDPLEVNGKISVKYIQNYSDKDMEKEYDEIISEEDEIQPRVSGIIKRENFDLLKDDINDTDEDKPRNSGIFKREKKKIDLSDDEIGEKINKVTLLDTPSFPKQFNDDSPRDNKSIKRDILENIQKNEFEEKGNNYDIINENTINFISNCDKNEENIKKCSNKKVKLKHADDNQGFWKRLLSIFNCND